MMLTDRYWWLPLDVSLVGAGGVGVGPQVNNFEQVSSDDHRMSVVGGTQVPCLAGERGTHVQERVPST